MKQIMYLLHMPLTVIRGFYPESLVLLSFLPIFTPLVALVTPKAFSTICVLTTHTFIYSFNSNLSPRLRARTSRHLLTIPLWASVDNLTLTFAPMSAPKLCCALPHQSSWHLCPSRRPSPNHLGVSHMQCYRKSFKNVKEAQTIRRIWPPLTTSASVTLYHLLSPALL